MGFPRIYYDNRLSDGTPVASSTDAGYDVLNLRDFRPYTWWRPATLPATVTVDCGAPTAASSVAVWGHDLYSQASTFEVRGSTDNFSSSDVLVNTYTPTSNDPFVRQWSSVSYRYWRYRITGNTMPSIAIAVLGVPLEFPAYLEDGFDPLMRNPEGVSNRSIKGHVLGRVVEYEEWSEKLSFRLLTWAWLRSTWEPAWIDWLRDNPFVFAWDSDSYPTELKLVVAKDKFSTPHHPGSYADLSFDVVGIVSEELQVTAYDPGMLQWMPSARTQSRKRQTNRLGFYVKPLN
jgi:hypothetical protein